MNIYELADILGVDIELRRYHNQNGRWLAQFDNCETKKSESDLCLVGSYGTGVTPEDAIKDYCKHISGKHLVFNAGGENRRCFNCPMLEWT